MPKEAKNTRSKRPALIWSKRSSVSKKSARCTVSTNTSSSILCWVTLDCHTTVVGTRFHGKSRKLRRIQCSLLERTVRYLCRRSIEMLVEAQTLLVCFVFFSETNTNVTAAAFFIDARFFAGTDSKWCHRVRRSSSVVVETEICPVLFFMIRLLCTRELHSRLRRGSSLRSE